MYSTAGDLDPAMIKSHAQFYAAQPPAPGRQGDTAPAATGKSLYEKGVPERGIASCARCHGSNEDRIAAEFGLRTL